jgi:hypothetical protein
MMNTTWIQIMRFAKALDEGRRAGLAIESRDAERLVSMLLDFQRRALHERPTPAQGVPLAPTAVAQVASPPSSDEERP